MWLICDLFWGRCGLFSLSLTPFHLNIQSQNYVGVNFGIHHYQRDKLVAKWEWQDETYM